MSSSGDERSAAGSRSSVASVPLSEVASSPVPASLTNQQSASSTHGGVATPPQDLVKIWRDPQANESQVRHIQSLQHRLLTPTCLASGTLPATPYVHLPVSSVHQRPSVYPAELWQKQGIPSPREYLDEQQYRLLSSHHGLPKEITASLQCYSKPMDRRELELREMERHKDMERERLERERLERERLDRERHQHQQQQHHAQQQNVAAHQHHQTMQHHLQAAAAAAAVVQQHQQAHERDRERREKEQCTNVEQAVSQHFEESLRRVTRLKTHAWQLSPVRPSHPQMPPHLTMQPHVQGPLPPQTSSAVSLSTMGVVPQSSVVQSQAASLTSSVQQQQHQPPPQQPQNVPQSQSMLSGADEQRRRMVECERIMGPRERERERERQREREKDRELDRLRQQQQELQQRTYYATTAGLQRGPGKVIDYDGQLRNTIPPGPPPQSKQQMDKQPPQLKPEPAQYPLYSFPPFVQSYPKDIKSKSELGLPTPPPLMSDSKTPPGSVIVKHDTHKQTPIQVIHSKATSHPSPSHYKVVPAGPPHVMFEYRTPNDRYKPTPVQTTQTTQYIQQSIVQSQTSIHPQQQQPPPQSQQKAVHYSVSTTATIQNKPKVSSPAPSHIYGQPGGAGIVAGIPVCRAQEPPVLAVAKSSSPSPFQSHVYGPPPPVAGSTTVPPPAHSSRSNYDRMFTAPAVKQNLPIAMHGTSPPTASAAPLPMSRSPGGMMKLIPSQNIGMQIGSPQTQPLDLGVSDRNRDENCSPKRKASTPIHHPSGSPVPFDVKKKRTDPPQCSPLALNVSATPSPPATSSPLMPVGTYLDAVGTRSLPLDQSQPISRTPPVSIITDQQQSIAQTKPPPQPQQLQVQPQTQPLVLPIQPSQSTPPPQFIPNSASSSNSPPVQLANNLLSVNATNPIRTSSADGTVRPSSTNSSLSPSASPGLNVQSAPSTPAKPSEPEKSTSPAPKRPAGTSSAPRHLKKAWLQRHTGEDYEDTTGVVGSGSCVKLPLTLSPQPSNNSTSAKETSGSNQSQTQNQQQHPAPSSTPPVHSVNSLGSNSINKSAVKPGNKQHPKKSVLNRDNGHNTDSEQKEESSSSDQQEQTQKSPPKRKSTKVKRRKGGTRKPLEERKKKNVGSESDKDSDSDMSEKDSDSGTSGTSASVGKKATNGSTGSGATAVPSPGVSPGAAKDEAKEPRKRGRRPKVAKDEPSKKKAKDDNDKAKDPFRKPPVSQLKKTGESFLQDGPCFEVAPKLAKCRECRWTPNQRSKNTLNIFCRFYAFRRLRYTKNGQLAIAGFSDPHKDPTSDDLRLWMPDVENPPSDLDLNMSRFLLAQVADQFCDLLQQEKEAIAQHMSDDKVVAWKRVVQGVREMCDVCETTLFNYHWACGKCGFVVCLDCYKDRKQKSAKIWGEVGKDRDDFSWLLCTNRAPHEQERLMLTQIIAGDSLQILGVKIHETRALWQIPQCCGCPQSVEYTTKTQNGAYKELIRNMIRNECNGIKSEIKQEGELSNGATKDEKEDKSALSWLADVALQSEGKKNGNNGGDKKNNGEDLDSDSSSDSSDDGGQHSTLRELLIRSNKANGSRSNSPASLRHLKVAKKSKVDAMDVVLKSVQKKKDEESDEDDIAKSMQLKYYVGSDKKRRKYLPIRIMTLTESKRLYPDVPHTWLCDGKLLRLLDANHSGNFKIFQEQWKRGQPVLVSEVSNHLNMDLWRPESFSRDFGEDKNDLVNCMNGNLVPNQPMKKFWDGFEYINKRLKDEKGNPMLLKLKDWPPGEDFAEILPTRFNDLMKALPLGDYTQRTGRLNLASRLPDTFVRPDLGPKMYNAYGSALHPTKGTTNLHLDISDAVNVMVYVGIPKDGQEEEYIKEAFRAIDEAGCDILTRRRVREKHELPGALWHIYAARDADKIRDLLNKVAIEKGARLEPDHDPIHDQSWYLDGTLRERLYKEYGVEGYPIAQCLGDAVFIPAGAPHQVRNLHNCIKVAEDFVSPENISHCFHLTQEFRELSETHSNHEDKLQIKNIIYHAVKDALSCLSHILNQQLGKGDSSAAPGAQTAAAASTPAAGSAPATGTSTTTNASATTVSEKDVKKEDPDA